MNNLDCTTQYSITEESDIDSDNNEPATNDVSEESNSLPNQHKVPAALAVLLGFDCLVREIDPDGGCLFGSINMHLFGNTNYSKFRLKIHKLFIQWMYFYRNSLSFDPPMEITVGVGVAKYEVYIHNEYEYTQILPSPESLRSYINVSVMIQHISNALQIRIVVFTYNLEV